MNKHRIFSYQRILPLLALYLISCAATGADKYAVLVGVNNYIYLNKDLSLKGPKNDVLLANALLEQQGILKGNITLLTDGQTSERLPTRDNIIRALDQHLTKTKPGDFVYLHFSGHGSQQPGAEDEIDGLDEIFLPADVKAWNKATGTVENAIVDNEISDYVDAFRHKGVFVWLVFDTCHSGTMTRGQWQNRKVAASLLGVPQLKHRTLGVDLPPTPPIDLATTGKGGYVAFFAAQTAEETPEMDLPKRAETKTRYGLFTYSLMQALANSQTITYRQLAEKIVQNYASQPWYGSSPMFVGDGLDRNVFDLESESKTAVQWAIVRTKEGFEIPAGYLHGLSRGTRLALLKSPDAKISESVGYVEVTDAQSVFSKIVLVNQPSINAGLNVPGIKQIPDFAFAREISKRQGFGLSVGVIPALTAETDKQTAAAKAIELLRAKTGQVDWVQEKETADVRLLALDSRIYLLNDAENLPCPMGPCGVSAEQHAYFSISATGTPVQTANLLEQALEKAAKVLNLIRVGDALEGDALATELSVIRVSDGSLSKFDQFESPTLYSGDKLSLYVANYLEDPLDITVLFVGSDYSVNVVFPRGNQFNRFGFEEELDIPLGTINAESTGKERLVIISAEARNTAVPQDFSFLAQQGLKENERDLSTGLVGLLKDAGFSASNGGSARSTMELQPSLQQRGSIHTLSWTTSK
jgi:hypothetical protein